ncbi:MAG: LegC family aminotransferase [Flavobacteriales bacterium]|nr:LegC family aminotransferase [Flavobacteriales bacterium]
MVPSNTSSPATPFLQQTELTVAFIRELYGTTGFVPLHAPVFVGNEKAYLAECIDTTFVSYVGKFVERFEKAVMDYTGAKHAVACSSGTAALHMALHVGGVKPGDLVLMPALTFVATANAVRYCQADPLFIDTDRTTLGFDMAQLADYLRTGTERRNDGVYDKATQRRLGACLPVHLFGHVSRLDELVALCAEHDVTLIEDSAEAMGSFFQGRHAGTFGHVGVLSFNGNKTITTGGGGMVITDDEAVAERIRHITTTAKVAHRWEFFHDELGYNYRLTNLNAAIGVAQMEQLDRYITSKRAIAARYAEFFGNGSAQHFAEPADCQSNYWLNVILLADRTERDAFLAYTNDNGVMTRPAWTLMSKLPMYSQCPALSLEGAQWLEDRLVNIPSTPIV